VSAGVVDELEVVEVEQDERDVVSGRALRCGPREELLEGATIGERGERIVRGEVAILFACAISLVTSSNKATTLPRPSCSGAVETRTSFAAPFLSRSVTAAARSSVPASACA
jgi:hypothetical protein